MQEYKAEIKSELKEMKPEMKELKAVIQSGLKVRLERPEDRHQVTFESRATYHLQELKAEFQGLKTSNDEKTAELKAKFQESSNDNKSAQFQKKSFLC